MAASRPVSEVQLLRVTEYLASRPFLTSPSLVDRMAARPLVEAVGLLAASRRPCLEELPPKLEERLDTP